MNWKALKKKIARGIRARRPMDYKADGIGVKGRNLGFMDDARFAEAYQWSSKFEWKGQRSSWADYDLRWRAHICVWAAVNATRIEGDFVEFGVDAAITSGTVAKYLRFEELRRNFYLFDTFNGIPEISGMSERELKYAKKFNASNYFDSYDLVVQKFAKYPNVVTVRGALPHTLVEMKSEKIAYVSVDLNNAPAEKAVIEHIWPRLSHGAVVVIDDYGFTSHVEQNLMWNDFARSEGVLIATLPTGQGLLIKS
jgi:hypothetical protein